MATVNRIGGLLSLRIDGNTYEARGNFTVKGMTVRRTGVAGQDFVHGYIEEPIVPTISGEISIGANLSIVALENITDSTAQLALANGNTYILTDCWRADESDIDAHDGKVPLKLEGLTMQELVGSST
jgi:hypothetical protein